jgi:hypothetical protein
MERDDVIPTQATPRAGATRLPRPVGAARHCSGLGEPKAIVVLVTWSVLRQPVFAFLQVSVRQPKSSVRYCMNIQY